MAFEGKYIETSSENFDAVLEKIGIPQDIINLMCGSKYEIEITCEDDLWTMTTSACGTSTTIKFKLDEEFDEQLMNGKTVTSKITLEGDNKWIHVMNCEKEVVIERIFTDGGQEVTCTCEDVISTRTYERVNQLVKLMITN